MCQSGVRGAGTFYYVGRRQGHPPDRLYRAAVRQIGTSVPICARPALPFYGSFTPRVRGIHAIRGDFGRNLPTLPDVWQTGGSCRPSSPPTLARMCQSWRGLTSLPLNLVKALLPPFMPETGPRFKKGGNWVSGTRQPHVKGLCRSWRHVPPTVVLAGIGRNAPNFAGFPAKLGACGPLTGPRLWHGRAKVGVSGRPERRQPG